MPAEVQTDACYHAHPQRQDLQRAVDRAVPLSLHRATWHEAAVGAGTPVVPGVVADFHTADCSEAQFRLQRALPATSRSPSTEQMSVAPRLTNLWGVRFTTI